MNSDSQASPRRELLEDFYAECDELLTGIRETLAQIEREAVHDPRTLEALFRAFHSIKGNCAIVGLRPGEELAHAAEDLLRRLVRDRAAVSRPCTTAIFRAAAQLEQTIAAHRHGMSLPPAGDLVASLRALASEAGVPRVEPAPASARARWRVTFTPSASLNERGVNVNAIRTRLAAHGQIVSAEPRVRDAAVAFVFVVEADKFPGDAAAWSADGCFVEPFASVPAGAPLTLAASPFVRVDLARVEDLLRIAGELVVHRSRLDERLAQPGADLAPVREASAAMGRTIRELHETVTELRLVPVAEIFSRMPFVVRDLVGDGDAIVVQFQGEDTLVDKFVLEQLKEPLLHLVRNAVSHGVEPAAAREAAGKPRQARITLRAAGNGDSVRLEIEDDGRGIDAVAVGRRAATLGHALPAQPGADALLELLCLPGFSTRDEADRAAGRGVGMAVVEQAVRALGGTLALETTPGQGTRFILTLPVTVAIADAIIVTAGTEACAVPQRAVHSIRRVAAREVTRVGGVEVVPEDDGLLPLVRLGALFRQAPSTEDFVMLVVGSERGSIGLAVDAVRGQREIFARPLSDPLLRTPWISGATELGDGRPILILDPAALTRHAARPPQAERQSA